MGGKLDMVGVGAVTTNSPLERFPTAGTPLAFSGCDLLRAAAASIAGPRSGEPEP
jgi:hypothetical protein